MTGTDFGALDATALAALVQNGEVSPLELVDDAIRRAEAVNGELNAIITTMYDEARERAAGPLPDGPFRGVPFLMKDFAAEVAGVPFYEGSRFLDGYVPAVNSTIYDRFTAAGLVTIGKTNLPELAIGVTTEPLRFGPTHNPWDLERTPGGSSGGAGAAVAARVVAMAHGNDVGGSIRIPAAACGLVGLKPSRGRSTLAPHYGDILAGFFSELGLTRSVRDTATLLDVIAGPASGEPYLAPAPAGPYAAEVGRDPGRLRLGYSVTTPLGDPLDPECVAAIEQTARLCESLGHEVTAAAPRFDAMRLWSNYTTLLTALVAWAIADWSRRLDRAPEESLFEPFVWAFGERGRGVSAADYLLAMQDVQAEVRALSAFYDSHDVWLTTTLGQPAVPLGTLVYDGDPIELRRRMARFSPFTYLSNASGQPSISLPLAESAAGLPIGLHFTAAMGREDVLLRLAGQLEAAAPWAERRPPVCAGPPG
ncbi:MAG: amidase [Gammaproteobacteria bacterium]